MQFEEAFGRGLVRKEFRTWNFAWRVPVSAFCFHIEGIPLRFAYSTIEMFSLFQGENTILVSVVTVLVFVTFYWNSWENCVGHYLIKFLLPTTTSTKANSREFTMSVIHCELKFLSLLSVSDIILCLIIVLFRTWDINRKWIEYWSWDTDQCMHSFHN